MPKAVPEVTKANGGQLLVDDKSKYKSMLIRAYSSIWMIGGFALIIYMGHLYITAMVVVIQIFMAKELFNLLRRAHEDRQLPGFRLLNWHFFFTAIPRLVNTVTSDMVLYRLVSSLIKYHMVICYALYISGFMWFILTLKKKMYKYQFGQYAWTHMILIVVFGQSSFTVASIFEGIFWFLLPATLIVINDIAAYIFGFFFGRTPLIKLSPKKTWEGFIGASISTIISAFLLANVMGRSKWLTCPRKDLTTGWLDCDPGPLFKPEPYSLSGWIPHWFPWQEITILPVQGHALCLGLFASIIAPFGGFFASGFKRAFKIKDFGDSIPGHGGITDRMDCQMVMAVFAYIYHQSFVVPQNLSVEMILDQAVAEVTKANGGQLLVDDKSKYKSMLIRAYSSIWMIGGFALIIYMGHLYITAMVVVIQIFMAKELFNLLRRAHEDRQLPGFRLLNWHFFFTAIPRLVNTVTSDMVLYRLVSSLIKYHMVICYALYISGFMWFILTLKKKMYKYQFGQYAWTHMILIVEFGQSSFTVASIFEGIFWFLLPATLIVINDIAAYIFGFFFGRTPLIKLSPKKTWEGFIGASISTIISAFLDLTTGWLDCDPGPLFKPEPYSLSGWIPHWFPWQEITILPVQGHALCLGLFASIIAPFGGFFASGFKRAFKIKMVMAVFAYIYHQSFVVPQNLSVEMILDQIFMNLSFDEQQALYRRLGEILQQGDCSAGLGSSSGAAESKMTENSNIEAAGMSASTQPSSPLSGVRKDRSAVWDHFDVENDTEKKAKCKYCGSLIQYWNGTSSMGGHLRRCKQNPNNDSNKRKITTTPTIDEHGALNSPSAPSSTGAKIRHRKRSTEAVPEVTKANGGQLLVDDKSKYKSMLIRAYSSIWMIGGFALIIYMGHLYITAMVVVIQIFMAKELFNLLRRAHEDRQLPGFRLLNWHFFFTAIPRLVNTVTSDMVLYRLVSSLIKYHMVICYALYISGFMWFILTLKKKMYKYQFGQYAWTHMILIVSSFTVASIFEGIFWFLLPATLIVINDIAAYIFGFFFGRTPLIKLSPKKTWEGFIGASISTIISAFLDLTTGWLDCDPGPLFKPEPYSLSGWIPHWFPWQEITILPVQGHALCLGLFASIIAPFGGFFASGFKRAFKIKDFGDSIPGHGGITDRMDCQMVMAVFAYIYHQSFVVPQNLSVEMILDQIFMNLSFDEQQALYRRLGEILQQGFQSHS
ncbi:hypothetical protein Ahy_A04g021136 isoform G [Arachis hypogaea]|uniref:Phosphatidate cytidylyltransferase n=1 Tax=Arachis hypogaea TaxID=3818 RepID=A0A445DJF6_ARAHY|nr:hypothetical protein Ahy_A04g021136 isoform G [Arachis hypogaea]